MSVAVPPPSSAARNRAERSDQTEDTRRCARGLDLRETTHLRYVTGMPQVSLDDFNLAAMERRLCVEALALAGNIVGAAALLGVTRHALKRRIIKYRIGWTRSSADDPPETTPQRE